MNLISKQICALGCFRWMKNARSFEWVLLCLKSLRKIQEISGIFVVWPPFLALSKKIPKNTTENIMPLALYSSHFSQESRISFIPSPECYICTAVLEDTHIDAFWGHIYNMAIWHQRWPICFLRKQQYECSILVKE